MNETDFKDHILTTLHKGPPSTGTRNFQYRMTSKSAKANLLKGANRDHFSIDYKQGASNLDFSDGSWLLVAFPQVLKWREGNYTSTIDGIHVEITDSKEGKDMDGNIIDN